jgi:hypothetical protein
LCFVNKNENKRDGNARANQFQNAKNEKNHKLPLKNIFRELKKVCLASKAHPDMYFACCHTIFYARKKAEVQNRIIVLLDQKY